MPTTRGAKQLCEILDLTGRGLPEVPLLGAYRFRAAAGLLTPHTHDAFEICFLREGRQTYCLDGRTYELKAGDFFVTMPGEIHGTGTEPQQRGSLFWLHLRPPGGNRRGWLGLAGATARRLLDALRALPRRCFAGSPAAGTILERLWTLKDALPEPLAALEMRAELLRLALELVRAAAGPAGPPPAASPRLAAVLRFIEGNLAAPPDIPALAARAGLSVSWFKALFRRETGMPPAEYILRRKVARACDWLAAGKLPVTQIAFRLGFSSSQYFATVFRRYRSLSPSTWRRQAEAGRPSD
ncbi:MAG: AraC family transcriptional regulator [Lentisphaeria bacterium]